MEESRATRSGLESMPDTRKAVSCEGVRAMRRWVSLVLTTGLLIAGVWPSAATMRFVPSDYDTIQDAVDDAANGDVIIVSAGTHDAPFTVQGKALTIKSSIPQNADIVASTVLQGGTDGQGNPVPIATFGQSPGTATSVLRGLTLTGAGSANGAIRCMSGARVNILQCIITGNSGPGVRVELDAWVSIDGCTVSDNGGQGIELWKPKGGAIYRSVIRNNSGGGIMCSLAPTQLIIKWNIIAENQAPQGGGIWCTNSSKPKIEHNTIVRNRAPLGAGIYCADNSKPTIQNCIIAHNLQGPGLGCEPASDAVVRWCDVYGNHGAEYLGMDDPTGTVGNISEAPLFVDLDAGDYHLKSAVGHFDPATNSWKQDEVTSPCIDGGDPNSGFANVEPTPNGGRVNLGRYGGTQEASKTAKIQVRPRPSDVQPRPPRPIRSRPGSQTPGAP